MLSVNTFFGFLLQSKSLKFHCFSVFFVSLWQAMCVLKLIGTTESSALDILRQCNLALAICPSLQADVINSVLRRTVLHELESVEHDGDVSVLG